jgi:molecular chaperone DnaK
LVYTAERALKDGGDKVPAEVRTDVEQKISELKSVKDSGSAEDLKAKSDALSEALQKVGAAMYEKPGEQSEGAQANTSDGGPGGDSSEVSEEAPKTEEAVEGEVVEEDKK